ncbi:DUF397 domain-containing protein [Streptomyces sp. 4503]|uniref:DUF397 domain-containing protein n=2 Tax=Streptomyces niphimycinicus TaxID=2842201 RepID=A0ABS6CW64_9ACTN|nr:DUF397 domain-containing protein [Streptomyces niphimycinicus]MBU3871137.1 DUF397 domain-containing protein [Streptomyces niphimycinicus]
MTLKPSAGGAPKWTKSSYSSNEGPQCVEVAWTKSSYSSDDGPECVEVATTLTRDIIHIRDSKNPNGPQLAVTPASWTAFVTYASKN